MAKKKISKATSRKKTAKKVASKKTTSGRVASASDLAVAQATSKAETILKHAEKSTKGFFDSFDALRRDRGKPTGAPTNQEQDVLRAALVFSAAGLDSTLKQLIRDALPVLLDCDDRVRAGLEKFVERQLRGNQGGDEAAAQWAFMAKLLAAENRRAELIEQYILSLTGSSLQSVSELFKACSALGLDGKKLGIEESVLRPVFNIRNTIIHELDIALDAPNRNQTSRRRDAMKTYSDQLLSVAQLILDAVKQRLTPSSA